MASSSTKRSFSFSEALLEQAVRRLAEPLNEFSRHLGWGDLTRFHHKLPASVEPDRRRRMIVWFEAGDIGNDLLLQINLNPTRAAVYAIPIGICTGWHPFRCSSTHLARLEAGRLSPILSALAMSTPRRRRDYRLRFPRFCGYSWERIGREGYPGQLAEKLV